jgi:hypothetical protein
MVVEGARCMPLPPGQPVLPCSGDGGRSAEGNGGAAS